MFARVTDVAQQVEEEAVEVRAALYAYPTLWVEVCVSAAAASCLFVDYVGCQCTYLGSVN